MNKYRVDVQGMTCTGCEAYIAVALEAIGAKEIQADFRKGEAVFELPEDMEVEKAKKAIAEAKYQPGEAEEVRAQEAVRPDEEGEYDYIIIGSGGLPFLPPSKL